MEEILIDRPLYIDRIEPFMEADVVKVLVGLRRSGKSDLLKLIQRRLLERGCNASQFITMNFEDYALTQYSDPDVLYPYLLERINAVEGRPYVFLDEIQEVRSFEKVVNSLRAATKADVYITGSNSKLLSGELATYLGGRYVQFEVYPFGYAEYREARKQAGGDGSFMDYLLSGGMPFLTTQQWDEQSRRTYLTDIYRSVVLKDIVQRHGIRDVTLLERVVAYVMANVGNIISANSIAAYLKNERMEIGVQTVINYLEYCVDSFLLERMNRVGVVGKKLLKTQQKYYVADQGLRNAIVSDGMTNIQGLLENVVALEARRRGYDVSVGVGDDAEVDFVLDRGAERRYIQVTYLMAQERTVEREFGAFRGIEDNYPKTVVSMDPVLRPRDGIEHRNVEEFLLAQDW
ncbi:ATP-binding protein [Bifidobacterium eulemuris]|uniref:ATPase n=1 Tax=Bifidobacterium eulemuris TaxID=1765219 RepID=A0A261FY07_9BIFI|nr:ATP-binding protein [Bifidobacterium eulemuris]OZG64047.1 ATPase [Bifidobacterium eulemuris]